MHLLSSFSSLVFASLLFPLSQNTNFGGSASAENAARSVRNTNLTTDWGPFRHGVASGDPLSDRVIIWTRVTPEEPDGDDIEVTWLVATDVQMEQVVAEGVSMTNAGRDYTVKADVTGLSPGTTYYYLFSALGKNSLIGRTKTTPVEDQAQHLRFGVVSCANYQTGYFSAFRRLAERNDLDAVIHLGDYLYENADTTNANPALFEARALEPKNELVSLQDYRTRYAQYRQDTSLIRAHQQHPFLLVWDDHEFANNAYPGGASAHDPATEGDWEARKAAARQAYFEWMPIRETSNGSIYRKVHYGNLMDLILLDTRMEGRDEQIYTLTDSALYAPDRTMLGAAQKEWLKTQLRQSDARWTMIGQQVMFSEYHIGFAALAVDTLTYDDVESEFLDTWDGYPAERSELIQFIADEQMDNVVILTGDFHVAFAYDVVDHPVEVTFQDLPFVGPAPFYRTTNYDPETGDGSIAVEFVTPSITAKNFDERFGEQYAETAQNALNNELSFGGFNFGTPNPHMKYANVVDHGYFILDVKPDSVQADWFYSPIEAVATVETAGEAWYTRNGENHLRQAAAVSAPKNTTDAPAPPDPPVATPVRESMLPPENFVLHRLAPNPAGEEIRLSYELKTPTQLRIDLYDNAGRRLRNILNERKPAGSFEQRVALLDLVPGAYFFRIIANGRTFQAKWVKGQ